MSVTHPTPAQERIVIIGAGNMATQLAIALAHARCEIVQIYNRSLAAAIALQQRLHQDVAVTDKISEIRNDAMLKDFAAKLGADTVINIKHERHSAGAYSLWIVCTEAITSTGTAVAKP